MRRLLWSFLRSETGSVAPTVGLALFALIAAGGIGFDYARLAAMDTELQNAADQAALAAASQLDGQTGACARAAAAAADLLANQTLFANETSSRAIAVANESTCDATGSVRFYQGYDRNADTFGAASTSDADARVVAIQVSPREAVYALTPVVGAFRSGNISAEAVASLGSAICKVPPVMMCNPAEPDGNSDPNFAFTPARGDGLRLVIGSPDAPGNFGFLRVDGSSGANDVAKMLGYNNPPFGCFATNGVETEPGNMISVRAAYNTRFDISENGATTCPAGGTCSPSRNTRKDLIRSTGCAISTNVSENWHEAPNPYRPTDAVNPLPTSGTSDPDVMGYPRDMCHAISLSGSCSGGIIGNGDWDIDAYFRVNYGWDRTQWMANTTDSDGNPLAATAAEVPNVTRYDVYMWEMRNPSTTIDTDKVIGSTGYTSYSRPVCRSPGITPAPGTPDRRRLTVAVVNCKQQNLHGHETGVQVLKWMDVFLVEPAIQRGNGPSQRTTNGDIYVEVIGDATAGGDAEAPAQVTRRDVPYLIR